jgi:chromosomal replication initiator protein
VLCADRPPSEIAGIEDRLLSRFRWGLSVDVQPPDFETRVAILQRRAGRAGLDLPYEVVEYLAGHVTDNIRSLEGALNRILAAHRIGILELTLSGIKPLLADLIRTDQRRTLSASAIRDLVAEAYGLTPDDLVGKSRKRRIVDARHVAMHFCKQTTSLSLEAIGNRFGGRDHSTVIHACRAVQARLDTDPGFVEEMERLALRLDAAQ